LTRVQVEQVEITKPNFLNQFILLRILSKSDRFEKVYSVSLLAFAILDAFTYYYGDIHDDSEVSFSDISEDYYPGDLKMVFIYLALVIPVALPIRLISSLNKILRFLAVAFTVKVLIGCAVGILRWVL
jgi:hypothetical protein